MEVGKATPRSIFFLTFLYTLLVCLHNKNNTHHITTGNNQHNLTTSLLNKNKEFNANKKKTYSLMYESPISQTSTILAFGLHSDITSCKASAKFRKINITGHKLTNDRHKSRLYHSKTSIWSIASTIIYITIVCMRKRARKLLLTISAALLYLVTTSGEVRSNSFSSLSSSDDMASKFRKP